MDSSVVFVFHTDFRSLTLSTSSKVGSKDVSNIKDEPTTLNLGKHFDSDLGNFLSGAHPAVTRLLLMKSNIISYLSFCP